MPVGVPEPIAATVAVNVTGLSVNGEAGAKVRVVVDVGVAATVTVDGRRGAGGEIGIARILRP